MFKEELLTSYDEVLEVVDQCDKVVRLASRREIHEKGLLHRAVHIFVFDSKGSLFVQRRSSKKDTHPLKLDSSAAGHVDPGETYIQAAQRELYEELGLTSTLKEVLRVSPSIETGYEHVVLYEACSDLIPMVNTDEIVEGFFITPDELSQRMEGDAQDFVPAFRLLWAGYLNSRISTNRL